MGARGRSGPFLVPALLRDTVSRIGKTIATLRFHNGDFARYGIVLDTRHATDVLGFEPHYRIELRGTGSSRRIETIRCR
jgi:hypothetical protein